MFAVRRILAAPRPRLFSSRQLQLALSSLPSAAEIAICPALFDFPHVADYTYLGSAADSGSLEIPGLRLPLDCSTPKGTTEEFRHEDPSFSVWAPGHVSGVGGVRVPGRTAAAASSGNPWAWGYNNDGELGDNSTTKSNEPVQVADLEGVAAVAGGGMHSLALKSDGTVWAWGNNRWGQLGDNTEIDRYGPVQVLNLTGVVAIAAGEYHSLAVKSDGTVWAWGTNDDGELGDNTTTERDTPVQVAGLASVIAVAAGADFSLALKRDGTVWAWAPTMRANSATMPAKCMR